MPHPRWSITLVLLLMTAPAVFGNIALPVYKDDPGYGRARFASSVAPLAVLAALVGASVWWLTTKSRLSRVAAALFGVGICFSGVLLVLANPTQFPDDEHGKGGAFPFRKRGSPRPTTREELAIAGVFASAGVALGGLSLVRAVTRREPPRQAGPTSTSAPSA